jgi:hypothetical protein
MATPDLTEITTPIVDAFNTIGIPYYIGGSVASSVFGIARSTLDVDLVAEIGSEQVGELLRQLEATYYLSEDAIREAIRYRSSFNLIHLATMLKVDVFIPKARAFDQVAASRVRHDTLEDVAGAQVFNFAAPEDIVLAKLEWYRAGGETSERQWGDILGVLKVQATALDLAYLQRWAADLGVADLLKRALDDAGLADSPSNLAQ